MKDKQRSKSQALPGRRQEIMVDLERGEIWVKDNENRLTPAEMRLLALLCRREGRPITVEMLAQTLDSDPAGCGGGNPRFHITNLRRKLGHNPENPVIATRTGIGYYLVTGAVTFIGENISV
ncbi:winged helix-turn-helix domain-containing protein [Syntrophomonas palmitatica]|uniref:winged helix-turn-helix domain-containing protein n=1 Tax=Syntrophomonas palmitatica TaxID=402877 RepID=UPI0006D2BDDD|nr:winged helix-turn-helix domain-containing protein [Syntrophomonas palmitatica]